jgi:hypothetical protein
MEQKNYQLLVKLDPIVGRAWQANPMRSDIVLKQTVKAFYEEARVGVTLDGVEQAKDFIVTHVVDDDFLRGHLTKFSGCRRLETFFFFMLIFF